MSEKGENGGLKLNTSYSCLRYPLEVETMKIKQKRSKNDENGSHQKRDSINRGWQDNLPSTVGDEDGRKVETRDLPQTVGFVLSLDYSQGCLELKKEKQSWASNWGLVKAID
ncbi:hypothetical protein M9H77_30493 [Catharanthus roseus]|uniref:Uncharacterized protein n=1 Tax=Catharanthus roseus TaxID=4058 RepID=A0ACB9ZXS8_CATRO|nr:hypothetical protein M9H77_30493 [Catharanthus roseus]